MNIKLIESKIAQLLNMGPEFSEIAKFCKEQLAKLETDAEKVITDLKQTVADLEKTVADLTSQNSKLTEQLSANVVSEKIMDSENYGVTGEIKATENVSEAQSTTEETK